MNERSLGSLGWVTVSCLLKFLRGKTYLRHSGIRLLAKARNPYSLSWLWIPGSRYARPGMTDRDDRRVKPGDDELYASRLVRIEPLLQSLPAIRIIILQGRGFSGVFGDALRISGFEHEGHGAGQLDRLEFGIAGMIERLPIRAVRQHHVVQADAAGRKASRLGVIDAVNQPHELRHDVHVVPG